MIYAFILFRLHGFMIAYKIIYHINCINFIEIQLTCFSCCFKKQLHLYI